MWVQGRDSTSGKRLPWARQAFSTDAERFCLPRGVDLGTQFLIISISRGNSTHGIIWVTSFYKGCEFTGEKPGPTHQVDGPRQDADPHDEQGSCLPVTRTIWLPSGSFQVSEVGETGELRDRTRTQTRSGRQRRPRVRPRVAESPRCSPGKSICFYIFVLYLRFLVTRFLLANRNITSIKLRRKEIWTHWGWNTRRYLGDPRSQAEGGGSCHSSASWEESVCCGCLRGNDTGGVDFSYICTRCVYH